MERSAQPLMIINTTMTEGDYRNFLYIIAFRKRKSTVPLLGPVTATLSLLLSFESGYFIAVRFVAGWIFLFVIAVGAVVLRVEMRSRQRLRTDRTGAFGSTNTLKFYEDKIAVESSAPRSSGALADEQFHAVLESGDHFMLYLTAAQALLIQKEDPADREEFREFIAGKFAGRYRRI